MIVVVLHRCCFIGSGAVHHRIHIRHLGLRICRRREHFAKSFLELTLAVQHKLGGGDDLFVSRQASEDADILVIWPALFSN